MAVLECCCIIYISLTNNTMKSHLPPCLSSLDNSAIIDIAVTLAFQINNFKSSRFTFVLRRLRLVVDNASHSSSSPDSVAENGRILNQS